MSCLLVAGLGNPGVKYAKTRHNVGFMVLDCIASSLNTKWEHSDKFRAYIADISAHELRNMQIDSHYSKVYFMKPQTFMNASGEAITPFMRYFSADSLLVVHDELDIPFGSIYFKHGGSSGGHNGLKSIDSTFGNEYARLRFGIGKGNPVIEYVLSDFTHLELESLPKLISHAKNAVLEICAGMSLEQIRNKFTIRLAKTQESPKEQ